MLKYSVNIVWSEEDEGFIATIPEFKNLCVFGETYEKVVKEALSAAKGYIKSLEADNLPLPEPKVINQYSGQIRLRMPKELHAELARQAQEQGVSLNTQMLYLLAYRNISQKSEVSKYWYYSNVPVQYTPVKDCGGEQGAVNYSVLDQQEEDKDMIPYSLITRGGFV